MHVISKKSLLAFWVKHPAAKASLEAWYKIVKVSHFGTFVEIKQAFTSADYVPPCYTVFDLGGNNFRIIAVIHYNRQKLYIREVFTHAEYDRWNRVHRSRA